MTKHSGQFKTGVDPRRCTSGRKVCGRSKAIALVDEICGMAKNLKTLKKKLQSCFDADPIAFFNSIIVPLRPRTDVIVDDVVGYAQMTPAEAADQMDEATVPEVPGE